MSISIPLSTQCSVEYNASLQRIEDMLWKVLNAHCFGDDVHFKELRLSYLLCSQFLEERTNPSGKVHW